MWQLKTNFQNYHWGQIGAKSLVFNLLNNDEEMKGSLDDEKPYAELWMGTHKSAPSKLSIDNSELKSFIENHADCLGTDQFGKDLPFLFKVLSVRSALSIQLHPSKAVAQQLHADQPEIYRDPNHKPEMAIAVTPFEALLSFMPSEEIRVLLQSVPELSPLIGQENAVNFCANPNPANLKLCYSALMNCSNDKLKHAIGQLQPRLSQLANEVLPARFAYLPELFNRLNTQFPNDVGVFAVFFLNFVRLSPGEAIFLEANQIHAYMSGECIEVMACSDNVVRAGLTPKFKDIHTLLRLASFECFSAEQLKFQPIAIAQNTEDAHVIRVDQFLPPIEDFAVEKWQISNTNGRFLPINSQTKVASILIAIRGCGTFTCLTDGLSHEFRAGSVFFLARGSNLSVCSTSEDCLLFKAFCNLDFIQSKLA